MIMFEYYFRLLVAANLMYYIMSLAAKFSISSYCWFC